MLGRRGCAYAWVVAWIGGILAQPAWSSTVGMATPVEIGSVSRVDEATLADTFDLSDSGWQVRWGVSSNGPRIAEKVVPSGTPAPPMNHELEWMGTIGQSVGSGRWSMHEVGWPMIPRLPYASVVDGNGNLDYVSIPPRRSVSPLTAPTPSSLGAGLVLLAGIVGRGRRSPR